MWSVVLWYKVQVHQKIYRQTHKMDYTEKNSVDIISVNSVNVIQYFTQHLPNLEQILYGGWVIVG